jgi:Spy/CpxP family protein refolding chaperone
MTIQRKNLIKIWCVLVGIFVLGGVTGAAFKSMVAPGSAPASATEMVPSLGRGDAYFETLKRELDLEPAQARQMREIIDEARIQYKSVCAEVRPRYEGLRESARARMRVLLSPQQQEQFDLIVTREDCQCPEQKSK